LSEYFLSRITIKNLSKSYGNVNAITKFSVEIASGMFLVLLGPSGCGKTTIIKSIAGLIEPTEGQIYIDNILINNLPPKDRDVAMVFQSYALYPHMSVYDNIAFPLKMRKLSKHEIKNKVENTANLLEITPFLKRKPKELSGGQMQRVALARALVRNPKLFLMDEPLSNLDAKLRMQMRTEIKKLQKKIGITTIYITHDQIEAMYGRSNYCYEQRSNSTDRFTSCDILPTYKPFCCKFYRESTNEFFKIQNISNIRKFYSLFISNCY
jgi:multiple sugar transport system ATP-binding protein